MFEHIRRQRKERGLAGISERGTCRETMWFPELCLTGEVVNVTTSPKFAP